MTMSRDKIQFQSRHEIDEVASALDTFMKEHPDSREKEAVKKLSALLDVMYIGW